MAEQSGRFPDPHEFQVPPELEGWEEMYPSHHLFSEDRSDWEKAQFWYQDKIHAPEPMPPLDLIFQEAWQISLSQYTTRVFCIPPTGNRPKNGGMLHVHLRHRTATGGNHR
jgi:pyruvate,water dikinase